jgi:galactose mutarotase-like enzyme
MGNRVSLFTDKSSHQIDLEFSENLKHFCVWKCPEHDAKYICLEPWTTIPTDPGDVECFNNRYGMLTLGKGQTQEFTLNVDFHS